MNKAEYRTLVGVIDAYLRNEPRRFREAAAWVLSQRTPLPEDRTRLPSRYGYSGYELRTFECMWDLARAMRERLHEPTVASDEENISPEVGAFRTLLLAWLLSKHAGIASADKKIRPTGMGPMPLLNPDQVERIEKKYRLSASPPWWALVRQAWTQAGDPAYMPDAGTSSRPDQIAPPDEVRTPRAQRKLSPCYLRAYLSYRFVIARHPHLLSGGRGAYTLEQHNHIREHGSPAYPEGAGLPGFITWGDYVRHAIARFEQQGSPGPPVEDVVRLLGLDMTHFRT